MARADYYLCDGCGEKCFYDARLNWGIEGEPVLMPFREDLRSLDYCGDIRALCVDCAENLVVVIAERESP